METYFIISLICLIIFKYKIHKAESFFPFPAVIMAYIFCITFWPVMIIIWTYQLLFINNKELE